MDTNINISNITVEKENLPFDILDENNFKNILSNLYLQDLESGNINNSNNSNNSNNTQSNESSDKYVKNFKPSTIFTLSVNFCRFFINIYNHHGSACLGFYFLLIIWIIFIR
jgi:hypothetical protein